MAGTTRSFSARILRCLLITTAWQAPLPFCHSHGTLADAAGDVRPWLADHLRTCHTAVDPAAPADFGWHIHFALPESGTDAPESPRPIRRQLVVGGGFASGDGLVRMHSLLSRCSFLLAPAEPPGLPAVHAASPARCCRGFFTDFAPDLPLPMRLGVMRC